MAGFLTDSEWRSSDKFDGTDPILKWKDVAQKIIFCLVSIEQKINLGLKFDTYILHYTDKEDKAYNVYAPSHFIAQIRRNREMTMRPYFVSHGLIERGGNAIASFEISYKSENKIFPIFEFQIIYICLVYRDKFFFLQCLNIEFPK